jgi:hypothetical protein
MTRCGFIQSIIYGVFELLEKINPKFRVRDTPSSWETTPGVIKPIFSRNFFRLGASQRGMLPAVAESEKSRLVEDGTERFLGIRNLLITRE